MVGFLVVVNPVYAEKFEHAPPVGSYMGCMKVYEDKKSKDLKELKKLLPMVKRYAKAFVVKGGKIDPDLKDEYMKAYNKVTGKPSSAQFVCPFSLLFWEGVRQGIALSDAESAKVTEQDFSTIAGEWIKSDDSAGAHMSINANGVVCFKKRSAADSCSDLTFIAFGDNRFGMKEDDRYLFEFDGQVIVMSKNGKVVYSFERIGNEKD